MRSAGRVLSLSDLKEPEAVGSRHQLFRLAAQVALLAVDTTGVVVAVERIRVVSVNDSTAGSLDVTRAIEEPYSGTSGTLRPVNGRAGVPVPPRGSMTAWVRSAAARSSASASIAMPPAPSWLRRSALSALALTLAGGCSLLDRSVEVPQVVGMAADAAVATLGEAGLGALLEDGKPSPGWTVTSQNPYAGHEAQPGDQVKLSVASPLESAADTCSVGGVEDQGRTLFLDMRGDDFGSGSLEYADVLCVLEALDVPQSVIHRIGQTRALDGVQDAVWAEVAASWTYHPDDGLDIIVTIE